MLLRNGRYGSAVRSLGTIVDSFSGCTLVCPRDFLEKPPIELEQLKHIREQTLERIRKQTQSASGGVSASSQPPPEDCQLSMETRDLGQWLVASSGQDKPVRVGVEPRTIAYHFLKTALEDARYSQLLTERIAWAVPNRDFESKSFANLAEDCSKAHGGDKLTGLITWEPHATLVVKNSKNTGQTDLVKVPLLLSPEPTGRPRHLTFDVVVNADRLSLMDEAPRGNFLRALKCLMSAFRTEGIRLNNIHVEEEDLDALDRVGGYFGLDRAEALAAVGQIRYSVAIDPWW